MQNAAKCSTSKSIKRAVSHLWLSRLPGYPRYHATAAFISAAVRSAAIKLRRLALCAFIINLSFKHRTVTEIKTIEYMVSE